MRRRACAASSEARWCAQRSARRSHRACTTWSTGSSGPGGPTSGGSRTSPASRPVQAPDRTADGAGASPAKVDTQCQHVAQLTVRSDALAETSIRIRFQSLESRLAGGQLPRFAAGRAQTWSRAGGLRRRGTPPQMHRAVVVPPGAGPIRGRSPWLQGTALLMRLRIAVCDGRPRAWAGERGRRRRPAAATSAG